MNNAVALERTLTQTDHARLTRLLSRTPQLPAAETMLDMLDTSEVVPSPAVPPTVVTMNTQVLLQNEQDANQIEVTLCYPPEADASTGKISVLSPVGAALLGLHAGAVACWRAPTGEERRARIVSVLFQPEAAGDFLS